MGTRPPKTFLPACLLPVTLLVLLIFSLATAGVVGALAWRWSPGTGPAARRMMATARRARLDPHTASLASDSFHPGPEIYRVWADVMSEALESARRGDA